MSLHDYVETKRTIQEAKHKKEQDKIAREQWSKHTFSQNKEKIITLIRDAFSSSDFNLQESIGSNFLFFYNSQINENAKVTFRIHETIEAEIEINDHSIGSIHINDAEGSGSFTFDPFFENMVNLGKQNSFDLALDMLIVRSPEFIFPQE